MEYQRREPFQGAMIQDLCRRGGVEVAAAAAAPPARELEPELEALRWQTQGTPWGAPPQEDKIRERIREESLDTILQAQLCLHVRLRVCGGRAGRFPRWK